MWILAWTRKLLCVDGVALTLENIRSGEYSLIAQLCAATRKGGENPNVAPDWATSVQGMQLVEEAGYVSKK
jgi:ABC-type phosphate transport system substrate-binding protein